MNERNYQKELDRILEQMKRETEAGELVPTLLMHSCCAPCSSYCLEYLAQYFRITVLYYNPNIFPESEYEYRIAEEDRLIQELNRIPLKYPIAFLSTDYTPEDFYGIARGLEQEPEGGKRCYKCYERRLLEAAKYAKEGRFDYFTTTLSISPMKNAKWLNEIGERIGEEYGIRYLCSDFKKKNGYKRSVELSKKYGLYRQDYCGCVYSKNERESSALNIKTIKNE